MSRARDDNISMMNILVCDRSGSVSALVRAALQSCGHRLSVEPDADEARRKIDTALFDVVIVGPEGIPAPLASFLEEEWPLMPIVLAGVDVETIPVAPVAAALPKPISFERLAAALRTIEKKLSADARKLYDMPVDVLAGERRMAGRVVRVAQGLVMVEPNEPGSAVEGPLSIRHGEVAVQADVVFRDRALMGVRVAPELIRSLEQQGVGNAQSFDRAPNGRHVSRL